MVVPTLTYSDKDISYLIGQRNKYGLKRINVHESMLDSYSELQEVEELGINVNIPLADTGFHGRKAVIDKYRDKYICNVCPILEQVINESWELIRKDASITEGTRLFIDWYMYEEKSIDVLYRLIDIYEDAGIKEIVLGTFSQKEDLPPITIGKVKMIQSKISTKMGIFGYFKGINLTDIDKKYGLNSYINIF